MYKTILVIVIVACLARMQAQKEDREGQDGRE